MITMNIHSQYFGPATAVQYFGCGDLSFGKTEDSGYNTTYSPDSIFDSESSKENIGQSGSANKTLSTPRKRRRSECSSGFHSFGYYVEHESDSYPITPVKRNCRLNPCKTSSKKLDFNRHEIHSLECKISELQPVNEENRVEAIRSVIVPCRHLRQYDLIQDLYQSNIIPPLKKIFDYLPLEDIFNFTKVSSKWEHVWRSLSTDKMKSEYKNYLQNLRQNQENLVKEIKGFDQRKHIAYQQTTPLSPPGTPRSYRFRKFIKSASLDSRTQIPCVRCSHPAKVTEETTGEHWALCTNTLCVYQFCRHCSCGRHPNRKCSQFGIEGPSPSKRKKTPQKHFVGSINSRKNLRRL